MKAQSDNWAVVGGGMLGMTLAHRLAQVGKQVTLYESAPQFGGLASAWQVGDITWDRHYHVTLLSDTHLRSLLKELGLENELRWVETKTGFYTDGKLYSMSNSVEFLQFPPLHLLDKFRLGATIFYASRIQDWKSLERIPVGDWLRKLSGQRTFEKIWLPLLRAKLGDNYQQTSAAFIWTTIARMYAARRTGLKKEMFGYVSGGYARVLARFAEKLEAENVILKLNSTVNQATTTVRNTVQLECNDGRKTEHDHVVFTVPSSIAANMIPQLSAAETQKLNGIQYQGIVCASVLLKQPLAQFYVTNITETWVPFTAVIEMTALVDPAELGGHSLVYLPKYFAAGDPILKQSDEEIETNFIAALLRMYPHLKRDDILAFKISRVRNVFPLPTLRYSENVPAMETSLPGVYIVNSSHILNGTLNVNEGIKLAEQAMPKLLAAAKAKPAVLQQVA
ncbi:MAG TPA: NAD(P)/FAD-dependent oxidoreductase [Blastocatellia bacterium]|nr:NAD(P)/FAD-dependent oxidoreductase [Blastocatellia bacterium]